jgi:hypothetical protein
LRRTTLAAIWLRLMANRALPDAELDKFVDALATRIASFDKWAIANTKRLANAACLPPDVEIAAGWDAFIASIGRPAAQDRLKALFELGFHKPEKLKTTWEHPSDNRLLSTRIAERPRRRVAASVVVELARSLGFDQVNGRSKNHEDCNGSDISRRTRQHGSQDRILA